MILCKACDKYLKLLRDDGHNEVHDNIISKMVVMLS